MKNLRVKALLYVKVTKAEFPQHNFCNCIVFQQDGLKGKGNYYTEQAFSTKVDLYMH